MTPANTASPEASSSKALAAILATSVLASAFLIALVYARRSDGTPDAPWVQVLPALNATLNGTSALCVVLGVRAIKQRRVETHKRWMLGAFFASLFFLISYIAYHAIHGDTKFLGQGAIRPAYFFVLASHILLSMVALPMVLFTFFLSLTGRLATHKRIARWTFPLWTYVSVTGVLVYVLLRTFNG